MSSISLIYVSELHLFNWDDNAQSFGNDIYENPEKVKDDENYKQVEAYTLNRSGKNEYDDHLYTLLKEVQKDYVNQQETGI